MAAIRKDGEVLRQPVGAQGRVRDSTRLNSVSILLAFDSKSTPRERSMDDPLLTKPGPSNPTRCAVTRRVLRSLAPVAAKNAAKYTTPQLDAVG